ncbi:MAG TPA: ThuA domain-containing protein, partial [Chitinophagaceae bacterium]|nr:ThuA domain-containing protein [Chitinophagaceae bacterium]
MNLFGKLFLFAAAATFLVSCTRKREGPPRVLVFTKTAGYYHKSIPVAVAAIQKLGADHGFLVDTTSDATKFTEDTLTQYSAVIFVSTTHEVLDYRQQADFERYIQAGGGYVGIHAASDGGYHWPWYGKLVGAYFTSHPAQQNARVVVQDKSFDDFKTLPDQWVRWDEWYNFRNIDSGLHVLLTLDESSYHGGTDGKFHPVVWYHDYDGGRSFYMEFGHTDSSYYEPRVLQILLAGIQYAIGKNNDLNYHKATALRPPEENRFSSQLLSRGLDEPTQMAILPNLDILISERKGPILYYRNGSDTVTQVDLLKVYDKASVPNVNAEEGVLGIAADPDYKNNHWVYVYYSPVDKIVNRLSRFKFEDGKWNSASEQVILEVPTQRQICCHTGGSIAFDASGNLYVSTGDNSTPFDETDDSGKAYPINSHGYAPLDDRPGHNQFDSRRSAGNTNDLRGKILRIKVNADGSYSIPEGNLFPKGEAGTKPEIYVMGDRNPYRISVDQHTGYLYWGEVGPDADNDSLQTHGPRGYDEVNQARKSGNFGWPLFVGNNYAYREFNYATGAAPVQFDPSHPVNDSRNNTGLRNLPPAQPAFIWYPYAVSDDFPILGQGGRCAMAGPVYYAEDYPRETRMPDYYSGKLFIYDWVRGWIMAVTMNKAGDLQTIEPFMPQTNFHSPIDIKMGPDGHLYVLEYGTGWFTKDPDAGLFRIDFNPGNRAPVLGDFRVQKPAGALPFTVHASAEGTMDPDGDRLTYIWNFGSGNKQVTRSPEADYTYNAAGDYPVSVEVSDHSGGKVTSQPIAVYAGNEIPEVRIDLSGNTSFYFPNKPISYKVEVSDREDGSSDQTGFDLSRITMKADYIEGMDRAAISA